ncbi:TetR/AcrR family transcriptional regulator [Rubricoccus marinus]|uniref:TetR/AcrR family transcriptional regulator n=1 Tax=Rubricoccus marinus TaxID=716817 RepID=UPI00117BB8B7|nr:TetR/AcrR family transcriptional regulator [Rubricoccus marinus]
MDATATLSRRDRERLERRRAMLDAALGVFADHGYDGATLDEVAERAEFGKGTLYNYFPGGKAELFLALFEERVFGSLLAVIEGAFDESERLATPEAVREAFRGFVGALFAHFADHRHVLNLFMREAHRAAFDAETNALFARHQAALIQAVARPLQQAMDLGSLVPLPATAVAHLLMGNVKGYLLAYLGAECDPTGALQPPPHATPDAAAAFITTVLFDGPLARA